MIADRLRKAVLQAAMQGKLTKQLSEDGNAIDLLKQIKTKDVVRNDIPFEVPKNWVWTKLKNVIDIKGGGTPDKSNTTYWNGNIHWASVKDIKGDYLESTQDKITELGMRSKNLILCNLNELILVTRLIPGKAIISNIRTTINQDLKIIYSKLNTKFLYYWFMLNQQYFMKLGQGTTVPGITISDVNDSLISIPPIEEQKRIVEKLEVLLAEIDELEKLENELKMLEEKFPTSLWKSILKASFNGNVVDFEM